MTAKKSKTHKPSASKALGERSRRRVNQNESAAPIPAYYDSMSACSANLGIPLPVLKQAKGAGCDAFRATRVYVRPLLLWLFSQGDESGVNWNQELAKEKTKRERIKRLREEKQVIDKTAARHGIQAGVSLMFASLERLLLSEAPAGLKGKTEMQIFRWAERQIDDLRQSLTAAFGSIGETDAE